MYNLEMLLNISTARSRNILLLHVCVAVLQRASCTVVFLTYNTETLV